MSQQSTARTSLQTEVIRHALLAAAEEVARNLCRTSYNTVVYEIHDYGVGIHDAYGDVVADAPGIAIFTRGNDHGIKKAIEILGADGFEEGDAFILNYPYWSSAHSLDPLVFAPIFAEGQHIGFASCRIHVLDLHQKNPGYVIDSTDVSQEGIMFPVTRIYAAGEPVRDVFRIIEFNSRIPDRTIGDIRAQISACFTGAGRTREIADKYGVDALVMAMSEIQAHGEQLARNAIQRLPRGRWTAVDYVDHDGIDLDTPIRIIVDVVIDEHEVVVDWSRSSDGVKGPLNIPRGRTEALSSLVFKAITTPEAPVVAGNFAPLRIVTRPGSVMHAVAPMPTFTQWTGMISCDILLKAFAQAIDWLPASSGGEVSSMMGLGTVPGTDKTWLEATNEAVGFGATRTADGEDGIMHMSQPGCRNNPVEVLETKSPMFIRHYGYRQDSAGAGRYRGGVGVSRSYEFTAPSTGICLTFKTKSAPWGMDGGQEALADLIVRNPGTDREVRQGASYNILDVGEVLENNTGGGGGAGPAIERDPEAVLDDVIDEFISEETARDVYGVVVRGTSVDEEATRQRRSALAAAVPAE